jgi:beta-amylase
VEHAGPRQYDFSAYRRLFEQVAAKGLKAQAVMSFHAAGGNVGDTCTIPLPRWVLAAGEANPDVFFTDAARVRNRECLSLGCDEAPVLAGRTPVQAYADFTEAFTDEFADMFGEQGGEDGGRLGLAAGPVAAPCCWSAQQRLPDGCPTPRLLSGATISEVTIGLGPAGELRYPAYPEGDGRWRFPGVGAFQCFDKYMLSSLKAAALAAGHPEW